MVVIFISALIGALVGVLLSCTSWGENVNRKLENSVKEFFLGGE